MSPSRPLRRPRLWVLLALLAVLGVAAMHAAHLLLGNRISSRALADEHAMLGRTTGRILAERAADLVLVEDWVGLHELLSSAAAEGQDGISYVFVVRGDHVLASSFAGATPDGLLRIRGPGEVGPVVVRDGDTRLLDVVQPILGGELGDLRIGVDLRGLQTMRRTLAIHLGLTALGLIGVGIAAAVLAARQIARPLSGIVVAADQFDPSSGGGVRPLEPRGTREIAILGERFNRMMERLRAAHEEQRQVRQKAMATERLVALGTLVGGVAHEVNNPLAGLKNCVRRLERADLPPHKRAEYLALMDESLARIEGVVRRLLDFGRPQPLSLAPLPPRGLAEDAAAFVRPSIERRGISIAVQADGPAAAILADRRLASQVLVNLLLNAAHVTTDRGRIRMQVRQRPGFVGISVVDEGPGIPPEVRERIFDPFFSTKPEGEGSGLGLTVSRSLVDVHGGELTFEFPDAGGTVATMWLRPAPPG